MRRCYLVSYDICCPKRWKSIHDVMNSYGITWQFSVFFCTLNSADRVKMQASLEKIVNKNEDKILIIDLGSDENSVLKNTISLGVSLPIRERGIIII